jgi:hypothetical protein
MVIESCAITIISGYPRLHSRVVTSISHFKAIVKRQEKVEVASWAVTAEIFILSAISTFHGTLDKMAQKS